jgi:phosphoribosyl 1,2-cyclic phosphodiesterase
LIEIKTIASGSTGNCYKISDGDTTLMIECGIRFKKIQESFDFKLSEVSGCLISHEHGDHSKSVKNLIKAGINCYMSNGTAEALKVSNHRVKVVKSKKLFTVGTFKILPFKTQHDCAEPLGFLLQSNNGDKLCFITDSYYSKFRFSGVNYWMIECNYDADILEENIKSGTVSAALRNRIVKSHFSLENVKDFFLANNLSKTKEIYLIHLSSSNSDPDFFKSEIEKLTGKPVYIGG